MSRIHVAQPTYVLAASASAALLALWGKAAEWNLLPLPHYVGPGALFFTAVLYLLATGIVTMVSAVVAMPRLFFFGMSAGLALLAHLAFFLTFGMILVTEEELAEHRQILRFNMALVVFCGFVAWLISRLLSKYLASRARET